MTSRIAMLLLAMVLVFGAPLLSAHDTEAPATSAPVDAYRIGPAISGTWYDPARNGEGVVLQMLPDGSVVAVWFTYPPSGEAGDQAWLLGQSQAIDGDTVHFDDMVRPLGARFGAQFNPADVVHAPWGSLELSFTDCTHATLRYQGPAAFGRGERQLTRFTELDEMQCNGDRERLPNGARAPAALRARSGTWYVPSRSGEGWLIEEFADGRVGVYWFTFDEAGRQRWIVGVGQRDGSGLNLEQPFLTRGARFGDAFSSSEVQIEPFGSITLDLASCAALNLNYAATRSELGAGVRDAIRLTGVAGLPCLDVLPTSGAGTRWVERAPLPGESVSELAAVGLGAHLYALGGFGDARSFTRYTPAEDRWNVLPAMPDGRHHVAAFALDNAIYMVGGESDGSAQPYSGGYRFDLAAARWEPVPELPTIYGSHAAVLFGRAYLGDQDGSLQEYEPRTRRVRRLGYAPEPVGRDHSQVVAFLDEIWMIGGRLPEHSTVSIYDPASGRWRRGPFLNFSRGGFAAAVAGDRIVVGGGEFLSTTPPFVLDSTEVYAAGASAWQIGPRLPVPVHGAPGAVVNGRFYLVSGSTRATSAGSRTGRLFELEF